MVKPVGVVAAVGTFVIKFLERILPNLLQNIFLSDAIRQRYVEHGEYPCFDYVAIESQQMRRSLQNWQLKHRYDTQEEFLKSNVVIQK